MVVGGRHPGHYFLTKEDNSDVLMRHDVCMLGMSAQSRASQFFDKVGSDLDKLSEYVDLFLPSTALALDPLLCHAYAFT